MADSLVPVARGIGGQYPLRSAATTSLRAPRRAAAARAWASWRCLLALVICGLTLASGGCSSVSDPYAAAEDARIAPDADADGSDADGVSGDATDAPRDVRPVGGTVFGPVCERDDDCASRRCARPRVAPDGQGVCVSTCADPDDCVPGWRCVARPDLNRSVCGCDPTGDERPNGRDDDCDGQVDEGSATIAFWNVRQLSMNSRDGIELSLIADVVEDYALVAIAEVEDDRVVGAIGELLVARGGTWGSFVSEPVGNSAASRERYGLLWRRDVFELVDTDILPEVTTPLGRRFDREPLLAEFAAVEGGFDFALVVVHVVWGASEEMRIDEVQALVQYDEIARRVDADVIIAGDLNLNHGEPIGLGALLQQTGMIDTTAARPATKVDSDNTYDHILLRPDETSEYAGLHGVDTFDLELFPGDPAGASLALSDHRPVWIAVSLDGD